MKYKKSISLKAILIIWLIICYMFSLNNILVEDSNGLNFIDIVKEKPVNVLISMIFAIIPTFLNNWWILIVIFVI